MLRKKIKFKLGSPGRLPGLRTRWLVPGVAIGLLGFLSITALHPVFSSEALADEINVAAILTPSITLTMSSSVSENIEPMVDGAFKNIATVARVQVNNSEYYDISISGNPDMIGNTNPDAKIAAISGERLASEFENNTWGYAASKNAAGIITAVAASTDTIYKPMPSTSTQIMAKQNTTNNAADDYYSLNFGAKVDTSIPADTYTSRVTLSVVASPLQAIEYSLTYDVNGGEGVPAKQTASSYEKSYEFAVDSSVPTRSGYTFLGWADSDDATEAQYVAGSKIAVSEASRDKTIYAVWEVEGPFRGTTTMQGLTEGICKAAEVGDTAMLKDTRDSKVYWVAKLPDKNCWMTQNIDYEIAGKSTSIGTKRSSDGGYFWENDIKVMNTPSGYTTTTIDDAWTASDDVDFYIKNRNSAVDATNKIYDAHYLMGNYYQYSAAPNACPSGWSLPTSNQADTVNGSFNKLVKGQSISSDSWILAKPYFFLRAGNISGASGAQNSVGSNGFYWSSTPDGTSYGYFLDFSSNSVKPSDGGSGRYNGRSVRCYVNGN